MFESVGMTQVEERVYRVLLEQPALTQAELARRAGVSRHELAQALTSLQQKGLAGRAPSKSPRFFPSPPEPALELLILQRQEELEKVRREASALQAEFRRFHRDDMPAEEVELLTKTGAGRMYVQLLRATRDEVLGMDDRVGLASEIKKGIRYRSIYASQVLESPDQFDALQACIRAGEEARTIPDLPTKFIVIDRRVALVPLRPDEGSVLMIHSPPLLGALLVLFERLWERAAPIRVRRASVDIHSQDVGATTEGDDRLLTLLAAGLKDQVIARQLDVARSTVHRRLRLLMRSLGAGTRFQAGLFAAKRGLL